LITKTRVMKATTLDGGRVEIVTEMLDNLKMRLRGQVIVEGGTGYDECRTVWNALIDKKPSIVVRCLGSADVIECVRFAKEHGLLLSIKGGGHNIAGLATTDGGMMLDMSLMRGIWVDSKEKIAYAQAGCLLGDLDRETQLTGLAPVLGFISTTGIAGLTLGGGFGYLTRRWGWTSDNVVSMNMVTSEGRLVKASDDENKDLFWGLRGGG
jgi:FAD/FMN-containing dehydrogenase